MSEAVEFRLKSNRCMMLSTAGMFLFVAGLMIAIFAYLSPADPTQKTVALVMTGVMYLCGGLVCIDSQGMKKDGLCRRFVNRVPGGGYEDPPLDSWEGEIESRDGFSGVEK